MYDTDDGHGLCDAEQVSVFEAEPTTGLGKIVFARPSAVRAVAEGEA